jgi:hypothetical protein
MLAAPKQRAEITPFDSRVLENFRLPEGQVLHRTNHQIIGADEMRKKKKVCRYREFLVVVYSLAEQKPHEDGSVVPLMQSNPAVAIKLQGQSVE